VSARGLPKGIAAVRRGAMRGDDDSHPEVRMSLEPTAVFSQTYAEARDKFLAAAHGAQLAVQSHVLLLPGRDGETLALDVARFGPMDAERLLILSSGCHGVEGFCGSAIQTVLINDSLFHAACDNGDVAVVYLHALNPYGFSWWRRVTQENVDLNRNFCDFSRPLPRNAGYEDLADVLVPAQWPPAPENEARLLGYVQRFGLRAAQYAITAGQYSHPNGLFFGGRAPTWSRQTLIAVLREHATRCAHLGWIDFHSGLGQPGVGEHIFSGLAEDRAAFERATQWWGDRITSTTEGTSASVDLAGELWRTAYEECRQAQYTGIALEFGTVALEQALHALRAEQWLTNHPEVTGPKAAAIKQQLRDAFYVDTTAWKATVLAQGRQAAMRGCAGLGA
jgi:hypothetical protein